MVVGIIREMEAILAASHVWFDTLTSVVTDIRHCFALYRRKFTKKKSKALIIIIPVCAHVYKDFPYLHHASMCACLQRPSLCSSCLLYVRMSTKAFLMFIMPPLCAHAYKVIPYLHHASMCACLQRPSLCSSCLLYVRMSTKAFLIFIMPPLCARVYKVFPYLHHASLCACLQRLFLSSSCKLLTGNIYKMYSAHRTCGTVN
jgi:hypothetical protein